jgi:DNA-binding response OmpR family regulator
LIARVKALLRRAGVDSGGATSTTTAGDLSLDADSLTLTIGAERELRVTPLESRLLQLLFANAGLVVHTDRLLVHVWGHRGGGDRQLLKQLVHRLRQKIGDDPEKPRWLETIPSVGYRLRS